MTSDGREPFVWAFALVAVVVGVLGFATRSADPGGASFVDDTGVPTTVMPTAMPLPTPEPTPTGPVASAAVTVSYAAEAIGITGTVPGQEILDALVAAAGRLVPADAVTADVVVDDTTAVQGASVVLTGVAADESVRGAVLAAFADVGLPVEDRLTLAGSDRTVADILASTERIAQFADFVEVAGLDDELAGPGEGGFTVFAPTNQALTSLDEIALGDLSDIESLAELLRNHVVFGARRAADLVAGTSLQSLQGDTLGLAAADGSPVIGDARLVVSDLVASNGIVHVIDAVLLPGTLRTEVRLNEIVGRRPVQFAAGSAEIAPRSLDILDRVAEVLVANPAGDVEIQGHTDTDGDADVNLALSQQRADAVLDYLVSQGVSAERLVARGYGETRPLADPEVTDADRATNRRIEFRVRRGS